VRAYYCSRASSGQNASAARLTPDPVVGGEHRIRGATDSQRAFTSSALRISERNISTWLFARVPGSAPTSTRTSAASLFEPHEDVDSYLSRLEPIARMYFLCHAIHESFIHRMRGRIRRRALSRCLQILAGRRHGVHHSSLIGTTPTHESNGRGLHRAKRPRRRNHRLQPH
jgi:hypothetical protein